ncbi:polyribonucleotide nucleotidyltransferase [Candidatus Hydrogenosomobacter endosymbioticus]|uniref:Polyribonucleotide nucleotidyltransferase n=2 Tax=Candidatus Hydrogenosomobacter endosymbioticus TaxID=2558174 RepID=A0ABM7V8X4_9PROT|nr:polyribonucleotide nucleotidyltransferase [Candidatus Hydrogenosomobacter endosymbioticus]BDB96250.1 polyribonucleotide nucleotidyltransferase [Candidatus Hydrogenosomobacter endosymbioticus]
MVKTHKKEVQWAGRSLVFETGEFARQADGAVLVRYGGTSVLCVATAADKDGFDCGFLPLSVHYQEKAYAAGKIPGGFLKRESKPSDHEVLASRIIDRSIRPLFSSDFGREIQIICSVFSYSDDSDPVIAATIGASAAAMLSGIPFSGPACIARVGMKGSGGFMLNPSRESLEASQLDLTVAGTLDAVLMVESGAMELSDEDMLLAIEHGRSAFAPVIDAIGQLCKECSEHTDRKKSGKFASYYNRSKEQECCVSEDKVISAIDAESGRLSSVCDDNDKERRKALLKLIADDVFRSLGFSGEDGKSCGTEFEEARACFDKMFSERWKFFVRNRIVSEGKRIGGRGANDVRDIHSRVGLFERVHGSALFTRGGTQAVVVATLGSSKDAQMVDSLDGVRHETFLLHYNFPNFSVGEVGKVGPPGRREVGHGNLAWRALKSVLPSQEEFPYTVRLVSEITESDGSSSMATVCGAALAAMDAGVPLKRMVSGIAMGLIKEGGKVVVLSDISGDEDHLGDMDFKVAGTEKGITALQMDLKVSGISMDILRSAVKQANEGREFIMSEMKKVLSEPRKKISESAPRITTIKIPVDKIKDLIGAGGKNIKSLCEMGAEIDVSQDGVVKVFAASDDISKRVVERIRGTTVVPSVGDVFTGKVVGLVDFGAFVNFCGQQDGLVHVSEICDRRIDSPADVLTVGQEVVVKVVGFDKRGKIKLSIKQAKE